jgi:uncharacterized membrane protein
VRVFTADEGTVGRMTHRVRGRRATSALIVAAFGALTLAACGANDDTSRDADAAASPAPSASAAEPAAAPTNPAPADSTATQPSAEPAAEATPPAATPDSLDFAASYVGGAPYDASVFAGKPVALWFWAPG